MKRHYRIAALLALIAVFVLVVSVAKVLATVHKSGKAVPPTAGTASVPSFAKQIEDTLLTCWPLTGPAMGTHSTYNFQNDPLGTVTAYPFLFGNGLVPDGAMWGVAEIDHVTNGNPDEWSFNNWRPFTIGKHVAFCYEDTGDPYVWIEFGKPQSAVGVVAEADYYGWNPITIMAFDQDENVIGEYTRWVFSGFGPASRASFLGLMSPTNNISAVALFAGDDTGDDSTGGFAFTDLQYRSAPGGSWKFWVPPAVLPPTP